jgi:organic radical activating enzyme
MNEKTALAKMISPGMKRPSAYRGGIVQIHITRACDKSCFGCTQGSNLGGKTTMVSLDLFEQAVVSLKDYFGVVGIFGGNPALHPKFSELCAILRKHIPKERCGLWCNHPKGNGTEMRKTFNSAVSNLNVHLDKEAYDEFKRDWPESMPFGLKDDSRHSPVYVAMQDVIDDEEERWSLIANCDINQKWSSMIGMFRGELRAWFCEIAGAQSILHQFDKEYPDTGVPVVEGWWRKPMSSYAEQVRKHCHGCGVPLRGYGSLAMGESGVEQVSATHADIYKPKKPDRNVQFVELRSQISEQALKSTVDYVRNSKK